MTVCTNQWLEDDGYCTQCGLNHITGENETPALWIPLLQVETNLKYETVKGLQSPSSLWQMTTED